MVTMTASNYVPVSERLGAGDVTALLDGIGWDAREDIVMPSGNTAVSAVVGQTHVKVEHSGDGTHAVMFVDSHDTGADALACHTDAIDQIHAILAMFHLSMTMDEVAANVASNPGE